MGAGSPFNKYDWNAELYEHLSKINKSNLSTKIQPEFQIGKWYRHIHSGSIALYKGLGSNIKTFGINPGKYDNPDDNVKRYTVAFKSYWYGSDSKLGDDWEEVDMSDVLAMFKKYFAYKGYKVGAGVHFMHGEYEITDDWYFDKDSLYIVGETRSGYGLHIPIIHEGNLGHGIILL